MSSLCNNWVLFMNMYDVTHALELTYFWVSSAHDLVPFRGNSVILQHTVIAGRMRLSCTNQTLPFDGFESDDHRLLRKSV